MGRRGRPPKENKGVSFTIYAPRYEDYIYLKEKARKMGVSLSALIFSYIASADEKMAERIVEYFKEVEERINELRKDVDVATIVRKVENIQLPEELENDPELQQHIERVAREVKSGRKHITAALEMLVPIFEGIALKKGYLPESRTKVKMYLVSKIKKAVQGVKE